MYLEPGGVADREEWEVCWAKPIGPIKQAERQHCINAAISKSKEIKEKYPKKYVSKQYNRAPLQIKQKQEVLDLSHVTALNSFVYKYLQAGCALDCIPSSDPVGFIYKVIISFIIFIFFFYNLFFMLYFR